ncbi:hypothetical protein GCM10009720_19950 [Yaniella flava]|uniref:AtpZ/AtpI family protein n=2 Tax=Yaniella flava TaxID=287930 RepID=A0ABP5GAK1_9MICC
MVSLGASFVAWLGFRAFADATRGDLVPALISLGIGAVAGAVTTWAIYARKSKR